MMKIMIAGVFMKKKQKMKSSNTTSSNTFIDPKFSSSSHINIKESIDSIISARKNELPKIQYYQTILKQLAESTQKLELSLEAVNSDQNMPPEVLEYCRLFKTKNIKSEIYDCIDAFIKIQGRFERNTINIGVSGKARVGKSTFLQTVSGLKDEQVIPTGKGYPVTAVRSHIYNSTNRMALLKFHTEKSFLENVVYPFHEKLDLKLLPQSLDDFKKFIYPKSSKPEDEKDDNSLNPNLLTRIKRIQSSIESYRNFLGSDNITLNLNELRSFVAYPTPKEEENENCSRKYLAVKEARIECQFPETQVDKLGFIDLPGAGEIIPINYVKSLMDFQNQVDVVVLILWPKESEAYFGQWDNETLQALNDTRKPVVRTSDYTFILINKADESDETIGLLEKDIERGLNEGVKDKNYKVVKANVKDFDDTQNNLLIPLLDHLSQRLRFMDKNYLDFAHDKLNSVLKNVEKEISDLGRIINKYTQAIDRSAVRRNIEATQLRKLLCDGIWEIKEEFQKLAIDESDDEFKESIENVYEEVQKWIANGLGHEKEKWIVDALSEMRISRSSQKVYVDEINRTRVHISLEYSKIDAFLNNKAKLLWEKVANVIRKNTGKLLNSEILDGKTALNRFKELCGNSFEVCNNMIRAINDLLALNIEYRSHLHPRVRKALEDLYAQELNPNSHDSDRNIAVAINESGCERLLELIEEKSQQVNYQTKKALFEELSIPNWIIFSSIEQFEDTLIRAKDAYDDFSRLSDMYCTEIWSDYYKGKIIHRENLGRITRDCDAINSIISELKK